LIALAHVAVIRRRSIMATRFADQLLTRHR